MMVQVLILLVGFFLLVKGADWFEMCIRDRLSSDVADDVLKKAVEDQDYTVKGIE